MFQTAWEFIVAPELVAEFERAYSSDGLWAELFRRSPEFLGTKLLRDRHIKGRYITVDRWTSFDAYEQFRADHQNAYTFIDQQCDRLTISERHLGTFDEL